MDTLTHRERVIRALNHQEPDKIPFDLGGTVLTSINVHAYRKLRQYLGLPEKEIIRRMDRGRDRFIKFFTMGNASFANMVRSAIRSA